VRQHGVRSTTSETGVNRELKSLERGQPSEIEQRLRRADGVYRRVHVRRLPLRDTQGRVVRWCVLLTNIDELQRVEDALTERERESRLVVDPFRA
jgi:hypothetical protein